MISWLEDHMLPCAYKSFLGFDCPACGAQRSLLLLLKGEIKDSFLIYPPLIPVLSVCLVWLVYLLKPRLVKTSFAKKISFFVLGIVMINYIIQFFI